MKNASRFMDLISLALSHVVKSNCIRGYDREVGGLTSRSSLLCRRAHRKMSVCRPLSGRSTVAAPQRTLTLLCALSDCQGLTASTAHWLSEILSFRTRGRFPSRNMAGSSITSPPWKTARKGRRLASGSWRTAEAAGKAGPCTLAPTPEHETPYPRRNRAPPP